MDPALQTTAMNVVKEFPDYLVRIGIALLILSFGLLVLRLMHRLIGHISKKTEDFRQGRIKPDRTAQSLATSILDYVIYFTIAMAILTALGVDVSSLLAVAGIGGVAIGFGCQTLIKDFLSGLFLWMEGHIKVGDIITTGGNTGTVENISLRTTTLRTNNGNIIVIPNGEIRTVTNMTRDFRCALVDITIAHGQDYAAALEVLRQAMVHLDDELDFISEPPLVQGIIATDGRAATIRIESRCDIADCWHLEREIRLVALQALQREGFKP